MKIVREKCGEEFGEENCGEERATLLARAHHQYRVAVKKVK
jgi:hypothetical protein